MTGILDGVRVLDLSTGIAGPITAMLLSDHGADVVRVEAPDRGPDRPGEVVWHRGTRRVEIDLTSCGGRDAVLDLAGRADVVLESFRPADAVALGLEHTDLREVNRRLVHTSITAYGRDTPAAHRPDIEWLVTA